MDPNQPQAPYPPTAPLAQPSKTNGLAITGFVLAFLLPLFGLIFSIVGLVKAKDHNGKGKDLAIAGIIISIITLSLGIFLVLTAIVGIEHKVAEEAAKNTTTEVSTPSQTTPKSGPLTLGGVYNEKAGTYSLKLPAGWTATQTEGSSDVQAMPTDISSDYVSNISINSDTHYLDDTLANFVSSELDTLTKYEGATIVSQADVTINGASGHEITADEKNDGTLSVDYEVILPKGNSVYYLKYETSPERGTQYLPVFKASAQSFVVH
jgi:hypothetical protein